MKSIKEDLERRIGLFINSSAMHFFVGVSEYLKYIEEQKELSGLVRQIALAEKKDHKKLEKLEKKAASQLSELFKKLCEKVGEKRLSLTQLDGSYHELEELFSGESEVVVGQDLANAYSLIQELIFQLFNDPAGKETVLPYVTIKDTGEIQTYNISEEYRALRLEMKRIDEMELSSLWGAWRKISQVKNATYYFEELITQLKAENRTSDMIAIGALKAEMDEITKPPYGNSLAPEKELDWFHVELFQSEVARIHNFIIENLEDIKANPAEVTWDREQLRSGSSKYAPRDEQAKFINAVWDCGMGNTGTISVSKSNWSHLGYDEDRVRKIIDSINRSVRNKKIPFRLTLANNGNRCVVKIG